MVEEVVLSWALGRGSSGWRSLGSRLGLSVIGHTLGIVSGSSRPLGFGRKVDFPPQCPVVALKLNNTSEFDRLKIQEMKKKDHLNRTWISSFISHSLCVFRSFLGLKLSLFVEVVLPPSFRVMIDWWKLKVHHLSSLFWANLYCKAMYKEMPHQVRVDLTRRCQSSDY